MKKTELFKLIKTALKTSDKITDKSSSNNLEEWDSLGHLSILTALDKKTSGKTSKIKSLADLDSVSGIIKVLKTKKIIKD